MLLTYSVELQSLIFCDIYNNWILETDSENTCQMLIKYAHDITF